MKPWTTTTRPLKPAVCRTLPGTVYMLTLRGGSRKLWTYTPRLEAR